MPDCREIESQSLLGCPRLPKIKRDPQMFTETRGGVSSLEPGPAEPVHGEAPVVCAQVNPSAQGTMSSSLWGLCHWPFCLWPFSSDLWPPPHWENSSLALFLPLQNSSNGLWLGENSSQGGRLCNSNLNFTASVGELYQGTGHLLGVGAGRRQSSEHK